MTSSSTRLRFGGAIAATSLTLLVGLGGTAFAEAGQGNAHRNDRAGARGGNEPAVVVTEDTDTNDGNTPNNVVDTDDNAHPSGNDRSVENGGSGNQGNAQSEPDGNGSGPERDSGGIDQPGETGGVDLADQDGNNGCGNDDDFEDDNEGRCGKPVKPTTTPPVVAPVIVDAGTKTPAVVLGNQAQTATSVVPAQVLGATVERAAVAAPAVEAAAAAAPIAANTAAASPAPASGSVLGANADAVQGAGLARTGFGTVSMVLVALSLLLVGFAMVRRPKGAHFSA